jgi:hypothetical protein
MNDRSLTQDGTTFLRFCRLRRLRAALQRLLSHRDQI